MTTQTQTIARTKVFPIIRNLRGVIYSVTFTKKDGSTRTMSCMNGVRQAAGTGYSHTKDVSRNNITVFEMAGSRSHYKAVPLDRLISFKVYGQEFTIN